MALLIIIKVRIVLQCRNSGSVLQVVPWNFFRVNVLSDVAAHYGVHPFHWYLSQASETFRNPNFCCCELEWSSHIQVTCGKARPAAKISELYCISIHAGPARDLRPGERAALRQGLLGQGHGQQLHIRTGTG